jgi:hypothetical protein
VPCRGRTRARARVWLEVGDDPDRWGPPISERGGGKERAGARADWGRGKEKQATRWREEEGSGLGRAGEEKGKKEGQLGWAVRGERKKERPAGLGPQGRKERGKKKKRERAKPN